MSQVRDRDAPLPPDDGAPPARVSVRALYANAMREVLEDPRKAVAEHEPWLLALLPTRAAPSKG